ncbi:MAG: phosphoribosylaminoimidazolesuccinocarboxamide synthase [Legionellales bacterium]|nr:phosphoribosylaminoimidazolesuccinocarboxamide synthase [Legionellales bacterium]
MEKKQALYAGKAKSLYATDHEDRLIVEYRDDASAFNGQKLAKLAGKGAVNNAINATIMDYLASHGIPTHFIEKISDTESVVKPLKMIPIECVIRNVASGSLTRRLGIENGTVLPEPIFENFLKDDALGDPMVNFSHITTLKYATAEQLEKMTALTFKVNQLLSAWFATHDLLLVDFKLEFGEDKDGNMVLGDEISPDGCRIWDQQNNNNILDKDRFRQDMGDVIENYHLIAQRIGAL